MRPPPTLPEIARPPLGVAGVALLLAALPTHAQMRVAPDSIRHIQVVSPGSGPPGTNVAIATKNLPLQTRVIVGIGSIGTGFEELGEAVQEEWGEIETTVRIPDYVAWDRPVVFIIFNSNFSPTALSDPFHVTTADGRIRREGRMLEGDAGCARFEDRDGNRYALEGSLEALPAAGAVAIEGRYADEGLCAGVGTITVDRVERADADGGRR